MIEKFQSLPMDLKTLCKINMVKQIKKLPPQLQEECIGTSVDAMKEKADKNAKKKIMKEVKRSADIVIEDITKLLIEAHRTGGTYERPEYTNDIDDELYYIFVGVAQRFVQNYGEQLFRPPAQVYIPVYDPDSDSDYPTPNDQDWGYY